MKKLSLALAFALVAALGCQAKVNSEGNDMSVKQNLQNKKVLVVYYSLTGNTKTIAQEVKKQTGADIFEIQIVNAYPAVYKEVTAQAKKELAAGYRPAIKGTVADMAQYDIIILGSPIWWGTVAMPVMTFLEASNLQNKTVITFATHGGGGAARAFSDIKKLAPGATVLEGQAFYGSGGGSAQKDIATWLSTISIK